MCEWLLFRPLQSSIFVKSLFQSVGRDKKSLLIGLDDMEDIKMHNLTILGVRKCLKKPYFLSNPPKTVGVSEHGRFKGCPLV
jgi:hypothetical protein